MSFSIKIEPEAEQDIQEAINWYNKQQTGLGSAFHSSVKTHIKKLITNPFYQVRYDKVRCLPLRIYPFMIHFTVDSENQRIIIHAVLNTSRNPKIWKNRK